jgi:hypothetical protein
MKLITESMLRGACRSQRALFLKTFPEGAPVTMEASRKARKAGLDVLWLANLLPNPLYDDYWAKFKPLYDDYWAKFKPLYDDYDDYWAKRKPLLDDYWAKFTKLLLVYLRKVPEGGRA